MVKFSYKIYFLMLKHFKIPFNLVFLNFIYAYSLIISIPNIPPAIPSSESFQTLNISISWLFYFVLSSYYLKVVLPKYAHGC